MTVYIHNGRFRGPVTLTPVAERLAVEISQPVYDLGLSWLGFEHLTFNMRSERSNQTALLPWCLKYVVNMYLTCITSIYIETFERNLTVTWLKYCRYFIQSINQSRETKKNKAPCQTCLLSRTLEFWFTNNCEVSSCFQKQKTKIRGLQIILLGRTKKYVVHNFKSVTSAQNVKCFAKR